MTRPRLPGRGAGVEDPKRDLLATCRHSAPACWPCVAQDMERQRDALAAQVKALEGGRDEFSPRLDLARCPQGGIDTAHVADLIRQRERAHRIDLTISDVYSADRECGCPYDDCTHTRREK